MRKRLGLPIEERGPEEVEVAAGVHGLSQRELHGFVDLAVQRYQSKLLDPGKCSICLAGFQASSTVYQSDALTQRLALASLLHGYQQDFKMSKTSK